MPERNGSTVDVHFLRVDAQISKHRNRLHREGFVEFEQIVSTHLPTLFAEFGLGAEARATLVRYADELKDWLAGILTWHEGCHRYEEAVLRRPTGAGALSPLAGPTGFGTSAARITAQLPRRPGTGRVPQPVGGGSR